MARLWPKEPADSAAAHQSTSATVDLEEVSGALRARVDSQVTADDAQAHLDLALAYTEMGLTADGVREAATVLGEESTIQIARQALNWLFARRRGRPGTLPTIVAALRQKLRLH